MIWDISKGARVDKVNDRRLSPVVCFQISYILLWKEQNDVGSFLVTDLTDEYPSIWGGVHKDVVTFYIQVENVVTFCIQEDIQTK